MKDGFPFDGAAPLGLRGKTEDTHFKLKLKLKLERQLELDLFFFGVGDRGRSPFESADPGGQGGVRGLGEVRVSRKCSL